MWSNLQKESSIRSLHGFPLQMEKENFTITFSRSPLENVPKCIAHVQSQSIVFVKADLHGTIFAYDCRMRFL